MSSKIAAKLTTLSQMMWKLENFYLVYERPNSSFYSFEGRLTERDRIGYELLTPDHLILRGSQLKEDRPVVCVVLYTGNECKKFVGVSERNRIKMGTLLHRELEEEIPAMLILAVAFVIVGVLIYLCTYLA